jgi:hypothetical protein
MTGLGGSNRAETYTGRTQWIRSAYALLRKLLSYIVGLGRVELPTSRLSGPLGTKESMSVHGDFSPVQTSRLFRRERIKAQKPPPARTQRVHTKTGEPVISRIIGLSDVTNPLVGAQFSKDAQFEFEQAVRREVREFAFRRWN